MSKKTYALVVAIVITHHKHMALSLINWFLSGPGRVVNFPLRTA